MRPLSIVQVQISVNSSPGFTAIAISFQIYLLVFDAPPQTLYKDIVQVSALAIHTDLDPPLQQHATEGFTGELASLVGVEDLRLSFAQGFFQGRDTEVPSITYLVVISFGSGPYLFSPLVLRSVA